MLKGGVFRWGTERTENDPASGDRYVYLDGTRGETRAYLRTKYVTGTGGVVIDAVLRHGGSKYACKAEMTGEYVRDTVDALPKMLRALEKMLEQTLIRIEMGHAIP